MHGQLYSFDACLDIYVPVLSQLNIPISVLLLIQHIHSSFRYQVQFSDVFSYRGCLPARSQQSPPQAGALEAGLQCRRKGERDKLYPFKFQKSTPFSVLPTVASPAE